MPIVMRLDRILADRKMKSNELAAMIGTSVVNLSNIKTGKIKGIRFSTLEAICEALDCKPGDLIDYVPQEEYDAMMTRTAARRRKSADAQVPQSMQLGLAASEASNQGSSDVATSLQTLSNLAMQALPNQAIPNLGLAGTAQL